MRILLLDDDESFLDAVVPELESIAGLGNVVVARSKDGATAALDGAFLDIIVLDLKIPTVDGGLDQAVEHGQAIFHQVRAAFPRTPVFFLTGSSADEVVTDLLRHAEQADVWGTRENVPTVQLLRKTKVAELLAELRSIAACIRETDDIEIVTDGQHLDLNPQQKRVLRVFTRRRSGRSCRVETLSGGLSGSRLFKVAVRDGAGVSQVVAAGKLADIETVDDEVRRFDQHVQRLAPGTFPQKLEVVRAGAGDTAGAFYWLVRQSDRSLFSVLRDAPDSVSAAVQRLEEVTAPWVVGVPESQRTVREVRARFLSDERATTLAEQYGLDWMMDVESRRLQVRWVCGHGDLHGGNVLLGEGGEVLLIDFGDVGMGPAAMDSVTLELSVLFHLGCQDIRGSWPDDERVRLWADRAPYVADTPFARFVLACRDWSHRVAAGDREVYATAYGYTLRQLKYEDTDKDMAVRLLGTIRDVLLRTY